MIIEGETFHFEQAMVTYEQILGKTNLREPHMTWRLGSLVGVLLPGFSIVNRDDLEIKTCLCCAFVKRSFEDILTFGNNGYEIQTRPKKYK